MNRHTNKGGYIYWYDFACEIFRRDGYATKVIPVTTKEYGLSKAKRSYNSRLDKEKLISRNYSPLPEWKDALARYLKEIESYVYEHYRNWWRRLHWQQLYLSYAEKVSGLPHYLSG